MRSLGIGIIGAGRIGSALAYHLARKGWRIAGLCDIDRERAREAARRVPTGIFESAEKLARRADILFLTLPDSAIAPLAEKLGDCGNIRARFLFHTSGIVPSRVLHLVGLDKAAFSLHPFGGITAGLSRESPFANLYFGGEGDEPARPLAKKIAADLGAIFVPIKRSGKTAYHLAASLVANDGFALFGAGEGLLEDAGLPKEIARAMIVSIARKAVDNYESSGLLGGLTGPATRGDELTIAEHIVAAERSGNLDLYMAGLRKIREFLKTREKTD